MVSFHYICVFDDVIVEHTCYSCILMRCHVPWDAERYSSGAPIFTSLFDPLLLQNFDCVIVYTNLES